MIYIRNSQRTIPCNVKKVQASIKKMLAVLGYDDFDIGVWFTTDRTIRSYNKAYRKQDKPTDILSFPYHDLKPGETIRIHEPEDKNLGDIIISLERAKRDAVEQERLFEDYVMMLLAHGIAHLLGYDHKTQKAYDQMKKVEQRLLAAL